MSLRLRRAELRYLHQRASRLLGEPVWLIELTCDMQTVLVRVARQQEIAGLGNEPPIQRIHSGTHGHDVQCGLVRYEVQIDEIAVAALHVINPFDTDYTLSDLWAVPVRHARRFYRFLRRRVRQRLATISPPIMRHEDEKRLWDNTLGFLALGEQALSRFGVALKRGVLLMGDPGNGKTLAARWLQSQAIKRGLEWRTVSPEDYEGHRGRGTARLLFQMEQPGVILFDDFDQALRNREEVGPSVDSSTFLSELDGISPNTGVVYLFTSNARLEDLDPAFCRPGRIDQILCFSRPDATLRARLIRERWPAEIVDAIPVEEVVSVTDGCNFAEVDEIRKLLVMRFLETESWDWPWTLARFSSAVNARRSQRAIGFALPEERDRKTHSIPAGPAAHAQY